MATPDGSLLAFWGATHVVANNETGEAGLKGPNGHVDHDFTPAGDGKVGRRPTGDCRLLADGSLMGNVTWKIYVSTQ